MSAPRYKSVAFIHPDFDATAGSPGLRLTASGMLATVTDAASVRQALLLLLSTRPGERVNRPTYGCHLFRLAFAPADDTTAGLAIHYVARAVEQWERRITVLSVDASRSQESPEMLEVRLKYRVRTTQLEDQITIALPAESGGAA
ncbi:phage baseplate assembly protein W [Pseudarthrobacter sp. PvP004]|uniref:GPW/gp25 family protein n=1 Tax=Pseudarthrobacter sp. PvP004 TaxID=2817850 RepID=UPI001AE831D6|nr:GPW/gp25 family protein [Pseudarthrobacter sp. PvP004]MBP2268843.1 phage baseplate assembly protein W [Pseudarthrobacter sp. PvP004]